MTAWCSGSDNQESWITLRLSPCTENEMASIRSVAVPDQVSMHFIERKCLDDLLSRPLPRRMESNVKVEDPATIVAKNNEADEHLKSCRRNVKKSTATVGDVIIQKGTPALRWRLPMPDHVLGHAIVGLGVIGQSQFRLDSRRAPGRILLGGSSNQGADLFFLA